MTITTTVAETIGHLDFKSTLPCEHQNHAKRHEDQPAKFVVRSVCPSCGDRDRYLLCESGWLRLMKSKATRCEVCGHLCHASEALTIVEVLS